MIRNFLDAKANQGLLCSSLSLLAQGTYPRGEVSMASKSF